MTRHSAETDALRAWLSGVEPSLALPPGTEPGAVLQALTDGGVDPREVDLTSVSDKMGLLAEFQASLELGGWFGCNWDALEEGLYGPEDRAALERVLVLTGFEGFRSRDPEAARILLDILSTVAGTPESGFRGWVWIG
jgi:hypothetical protein